MPRPRPAPKRITVHDIAREAKVSIGTVSRALNNAANINADTRERVMAISRRLGMRPRGLARRRHFALLVPDREKVVSGGYVDIMVQELLYALSRHGCALSVFTDRQADEIGRWLFDGIFSASWSQLALDTVATLKETPIIAINYTGDRHPAFHVVGWDHEAEGRRVAEYFLDRGHRRLGLIGTQPASSRTNTLRVKGYADACRAAGQPLQLARVELLETRTLLYAAVQRVIDEKADAIFLPGQQKLAVEALHIIQKMLGLKIPGDISLIGGENPGWSELLDPPLTTVTAPFQALAELAVSHMLDLVANRPRKMTEMILQTTIIERKSVAQRGRA